MSSETYLATGPAPSSMCIVVPQTNEGGLISERVLVVDGKTPVTSSYAVCRLASSLAVWGLSRAVTRGDLPCSYQLVLSDVHQAQRQKEIDCPI